MCVYVCESETSLTSSPQSLALLRLSSSTIIVVAPLISRVSLSVHSDSRASEVSLRFQ